MRPLQVPFGEVAQYGVTGMISIRILYHLEVTGIFIHVSGLFVRDQRSSVDSAASKNARRLARPARMFVSASPIGAMCRNCGSRAKVGLRPQVSHEINRPWRLA